MNILQQATSLVFVHLSDIHFRYKRSGVTYDLDTSVRNALEHDVGYWARNFDRIDGVLVSGDIAFGGKPEEYTIAKQWLGKLAGLAKCPVHNVFTIPGNHDIDRDVFKDNDYIYGWHKDILGSAEEVDDKLGSYMKNELKVKPLFASMKAYQNFAKENGCFTTPQEPYWERDFALSGSVKVRIRGINSAILCSDRDTNIASNQLVVGEWQASHAREDGVICVSMCHHPPRWLIDQKTFDLCMLAPDAVPLQLFGHEHEFQVDPRENSLRLYAGAVQPSRSEEGWLPRYNLIELTGVQKDSEIHFQVRVWARAWNKTNRRFEADAKCCSDEAPFTWQTVLGKREKISGSELKIKVSAEPNVLSIQQSNEQGEASEVDATQELVNAFLTLPYHQIAEIANELDLVNDEDEDISAVEQYRRYFQRARQRSDGFKQLWEKVAQYHSAFSGRLNPFTTEEK